MATLIYNATQLQAMSSDLAGDYELANDIDLTGVTWTPVGTGTGVGRFAGSLDGAGFAITNLTINTPTVDYVGLFGSTVGATITRIGDITGSVTGKDNVGPLIGRAYTSAVSLCKCSAAVTGVNYAGGLVGVNQTSATITDCYATGAVTATTSFAGGLVGYNQTSATITGSFASGLASAGTSYANDLVGVALITSIIKSSTGLTTDDIKDPLWYFAADWDFASTWQQGVVIPNLVGGDLDDAGKLLYPVGCTVGTITYAYSATVAAGLIISQSVAAGSGTATTPSLQALTTQASPKTGDTVDVVVSLGYSVEVPNVKGLTLANATTSLTTDYFTVTSTTAYSSDFAAGLVISQSPAAGTSAAYGSEVTVTISLGPVIVPVVPNVVGRTQAAATAVIEAVGLVASATTAHSDYVALGKVISQDIAPDTVVDPGDSVGIVVSLGVRMGTMPDVVGETYETGAGLVTSAGFDLVTSRIHSDDVAANIIISQYPLADASAIYGSTANIMVSSGAAQVEDDSFKNTRWVPCDNRGSGFVNVAFVDGKIGYTAKTTGSARIRRIEVRYQSHDRRTIRGTRPMPTNNE